jgi:hypothetical protein
MFSYHPLYRGNQMTTRLDKHTNTASIKELLSLERYQVALSQLYLDPRNPRFGGNSKLPDTRIAEGPIQENARKKIEEIGVEDLLSSIRTHGFVPTDPIVVREFSDGKYVALEGNRRVGTLKKLSDSHTAGETHLPEEILKSIEELEVLVYKGKDPNIAWIIQGLRHMSGIKQWQPLQQAMFVSKVAKEMEGIAKKKGDPVPGLPQIAKSAGIAVGVANRLLRSYDGFIQAREDAEFGSKFEDGSKFSVFAEAVFKADSLQKWLAWDDKKRCFADEANFKTFLSWITEPEGGGDPKVSRALDMRDVISEVVTMPDLLRQFERGTIDLNQARVEIDRNRPIPEPDLSALKSKLSEINNVVETLPMPKIHREKQWDDFQKLLQTLAETINFQLGSSLK